MALARCEACGRPKGTRCNYFHSYVPDRRIVCGANRCTRLANLLWLTDEEERNYLQGQRTFRVPGQAAEVQVA